MKRLNQVQNNQVKDWLLFTAFFTSDREKSLEIVQSFLIKPSTKYYVPHVKERGFRYILKRLKAEKNCTASNMLFSECSFDLLSEIDQAILLLYYYFQLNIKKIARIVGKNIREIRRRQYSFLQLLATKGISIHTFMDKLQKKGRMIEFSISADAFNQESLIIVKKTALYSFIILHLLIVGGAMNSGIVEKTQAKQGPNLLNFYKGKTLDEIIKTKLAEVFQKDDFSVFVNFEEEKVYVSVDKEELYQKKSKIIRFVYQILKEKEITFAVQVEYDTKALEKDESAYLAVMEADKKRINLWPGDYSDQGKVLEWIVSFPNDIELVTEQAELTRVQKILNKYNHKAPITVSYFDKEKVDRRERWLKLSTYFEEGFLLGKEYNIERISINTYTKEVSIDVYTYFLTKDNNKEEIARAVKRSLDQFLQSEEVKQIVQNDAYTINIYSAGKKKIKIHY